MTEPPKLTDEQNKALTDLLDHAYIPDEAVDAAGAARDRLAYLEEEVALLRAIFADRVEIEGSAGLRLAREQGRREGKAMVKLYHWHGPLADWLAGDVIAVSSSLEEARATALVLPEIMDRDGDRQLIADTEPTVVDVPTAMGFAGSA